MTIALTQCKLSQFDDIGQLHHEMTGYMYLKLKRLLIDTCFWMWPHKEQSTTRKPKQKVIFDINSCVCSSNFIFWKNSPHFCLSISSFGVRRSSSSTRMCGTRAMSKLVFCWPLYCNTEKDLIFINLLLTSLSLSLSLSIHSSKNINYMLLITL